jgi:hypothetical protein
VIAGRAIRWRPHALDRVAVGFRNRLPDRVALLNGRGSQRHDTSDEDGRYCRREVRRRCGGGIALDDRNSASNSR